MTHDTDKRQKCLMYRLTLFHYEYFIPEKTEMEVAEICRTKKLMRPFSEDLHFVSSILNIHQWQSCHCSFVSSESSLAFFTSETIEPVTHHA